MKSSQTAALILLLLVGLVFWLFTQGKLKSILQIITGAKMTGIGPDATIVTPGATGRNPVASNVIGGSLTSLGTIAGNGIVSGDGGWQSGYSTGNVQPLTSGQAKGIATDTALGLVASLGPVGAIGASIAKALGFRF